MADTAAPPAGTLDLLILEFVWLGRLHGGGVLPSIEQVTGGALQIQQGATSAGWTGSAGGRWTSSPGCGCWPGARSLTGVDSLGMAVAIAFGAGGFDLLGATARPVGRRRPPQQHTGDGACAVPGVLSRARASRRAPSLP